MSKAATNEGAPPAVETAGRMVRFGGVGIANTATDFITFAALLAAGAPPLGANAAGFLAANAQSYFLNARFTFQRAGRAAPLSLVGYGKFAAAHLLSLAISTAMILAFSQHIGPLLAKASAAAFTFVWNFTASALLVFRTPQGQDEAAS